MQSPLLSSAGCQPTIARTFRSLFIRRHLCAALALSGFAVVILRFVAVANKRNGKPKFGTQLHQYIIHTNGKTSRAKKASKTRKFVYINKCPCSKPGSEAAAAASAEHIPCQSIFAPVACSNHLRPRYAATITMCSGQLQESVEEGANET